VKENTINREINELNMKIENIKEEVTHDMENHKKKNQTKTQNTVENHSSKLEQVEDRISELKDKIEIKEKTELLVKQLKICKRNIQELTNSIKRPNLRIMDTDEEVQAKEICNRFKKIITKISQISRMLCPIKY
jgi:tRNA U34 5-carboxymethylaminomethyl modifying GTPase MnmE/TrmE